MRDLRTAASAELFYKRNDPNDKRLGEIVSSDLAYYDEAELVILGCPQDEGVKRNKGRLGAAEAPDAIREQLYKLGVWGLEPVKLFDLGNTRTEGSLEDIHERQQQLVQQVIKEGKRLIVLGGGNDISYPDASGLALELPDLLAFNIDAHFDVRADSPRNSGTPYRQLLDEGFLKPEKFIEVGFQPYANSPIYFEYLNTLGVTCIARQDVQKQGITSLFEKLLKIPAQAIFWGFDMDVLSAADAPGVSALNPVGLNSKDALELANLAGQDKRTRVFEISEVNPRFDLDNRTSRLAAVIIWQFIHAFIKGGS